MKKRFFKLACGTLLLGLSIIAIVENLEDPTLERAKEGDVLSQNILAYRLCDDGNYREGLYWLEQAAKQNSSQAILRLANAYYGGKCSIFGAKQFSEDYSLALKWYEKLLFVKDEKGSYSYSAKLRIADIYYFGKGGIPVDDTIAKMYYTEVANITESEIQNAGSPYGDFIKDTRGAARYRLAQTYFFGDFVRQDYQLAYQWANKAHQDNNPYGTRMMAVLQYEGKGTPQDRNKAKELMGQVCDIGIYQQACDWYQDMQANRPLRGERL